MASRIGSCPRGGLRFSVWCSQLVRVQWSAGPVRLEFPKPPPRRRTNCFEAGVQVDRPGRSVQVRFPPGESVCNMRCLGGSRAPSNQGSRASSTALCRGVLPAHLRLHRFTRAQTYGEGRLSCLPGGLKVALSTDGAPGESCRDGVSASAALSLLRSEGQTTRSLGPYSYR